MNFLVLTSRRLEWYFCFRFTELHLENQIQQGFWNGLPAGKNLKPYQGLKQSIHLNQKVPIHAGKNLFPHLGLETPKLQNYWLKNRLLLSLFISSHNLKQSIDYAPPSKIFSHKTRPRKPSFRSYSRLLDRP